MSLMDQTSHLIFRWRKLELSNWKSMLDQILYGLREDTMAKYTIQILDVVFEKHSISRRVAFVQTLIQFIESATLADYQSRLDILQACLYFIKLSGEDTRKWLVAALHNILKYYATFSASIASQLDNVYKRCEKKIVEFVKMARWKDTNFWSVKNMIDKTRKILHKTIREYKKQITLPCRNFLLENASDTEITDPQPVFLKPERVMHTTALAESFLDIKSGKGEIVGNCATMSSKAVRLTTKIRKHLKEVNFGSTISELTPEIIREMEILQNLDVNRCVFYNIFTFGFFMHFFKNSIYKYIFV